MVEVHVKKVLVVDDKEEVGGILSEYFEKEGIKTTVIYNGESAFKIIQEEKPDLLLLDIRPGIDGMEVVRRVKTLDSD